MPSQVISDGLNKQHRRDALEAIATDNISHLIPALVLADPSLATAFSRTVSYDCPPSTTAFENGIRPTKFGFRRVDSLDAAEELVGRWGEEKVAVLNMANATKIGGGYVWGATAQEEALCRRSTLYSHINYSKLYPLHPEGGLWSERVRVIRESDDRSSEVLDVAQRFEIGIISVAAVKKPVLTEDGTGYGDPQDERLMERKILAILRIAKLNQQRGLVLGAFGCGAFHNPPRIVASIFHRLLTADAEFRNAFDEVIFAILS